MSPPEQSPADSSPSPSGSDAASPSRRRFLEIVTTAMGGAVGLVLAVPLVRYLLFPVRREVVADPGKPLDVLAADALQPGAPPVRVQLSAANVRNAWAVADDVALGSAWLRKDEKGNVEALSAACPHLGCAVDFDAGAGHFKCPCHRSAFSADGKKLSGPSKRDLDPLPVVVENGRVKVTYVRYRPDVPRSEAGGLPAGPGGGAGEPGGKES